MIKAFYAQAITLMFLMVLLSCKKNNLPQIKEDKAKIILIKYACDPACDAIGYIVQIKDSTLYNPGSLPTDFRVNNLPVKIIYNRTGNFPELYAGPYYEQIYIL